jgi:hypothetical protein
MAENAIQRWENPKAPRGNAPPNIAPEQRETRAKALAKELLATGHAPAGLAGLLGAKASDA